MDSARRTGSVGGPPALRHAALSWPLPVDDDEERAWSSPGAEVVPVHDEVVPVDHEVDHEFERYLLDLGAARREGLRVGGRLVAFIGLGLAVGATGWMNVTGFFSPSGTRPSLIDQALMWAFAAAGTLLVVVSMILLAMAVADARSRRRRMGAWRAL